MIKASALSLCSVMKEREPKLSIFKQNNQNIIIDETSKEKVSSGVEELACKLMRHDSLIKEYIVTLRDNFTCKREDFHFSLAGKTEKEKKIIVELFEEMYGIVTSLYYCPETQMLNGRISLAPKVQGFISGQYMEIAVCKQVKDVLADLSSKQNKKFEVYRNVKVSTKEGQLKNEFDVVIESEAGDIWVVEVKSGHCFRNYAQYTSIGRTYGIVPNQFLLVSNSLSEKQCETVQYFCDYYVCNLESDSFVRKLTTMIENIR